MHIKPSLAYLLQEARRGDRLMVRLGAESPQRAEHLFVFQKKANATLPPNIRVGKVANINSWLALIPAPGTTFLQLEAHGERLASIFGSCRVERNEK